MALNYEKINEEIVKIAKSIGYSIAMFDEEGSGPLSDSARAKYISLSPDGIMISLPQGNTSDIEEIWIYVGSKKDKNKFLKLIDMIKKAAHFNGLGFTIKNLAKDRVTPKDFSGEARKEADREEKE